MQSLSFALRFNGRKRVHDADEAMARRRAAWRPPEAAMAGGYQSMYIAHVQQADRGADLDFLVGCRGAAVPRESH